MYPVLKSVACLTGTALAECIEIGTRRNAANVQAHTTNRNYSGRDDTLISIQGVVGELAFLKWFGLPTVPLWDTECRHAGNDTFDATLQGFTIDVKSPINHHCGLRVTAHKRRNPPAGYALITIERTSRDEPFTAEEQVQLQWQGFITSTDLFQPGYLHPSKKYYEVRQCHLYDTQTWLQKLQKPN